MPWLIAAMYDRFMRASEVACLGQWRTELLRDLQGEVLEVGAGTGVNLPYYPRTISRLVVSEPDHHMRRRLQTKCESLAQPQVEVLSASLESLPMASASFDVVVSTLVLCSVPNLHVALTEVFRVLRPGGCLVFLEHVAADRNPRLLKWQSHLEPVWKCLAGNCHLTRQTEGAILATGGDIEWIQHENICKMVPLVRPSIRGVARKL